MSKQGAGFPAKMAAKLKEVTFAATEQLARSSLEADPATKHGLAASGLHSETAGAFLEQTGEAVRLQIRRYMAAVETRLRKTSTEGGFHPQHELTTRWSRRRGMVPAEVLSSAYQVRGGDLAAARREGERRGSRWSLQLPMCPVQTTAGGPNA